MMLVKIAFRNILRNARRSLMTLSAIAAGAIAMILFGGFMGNIITGLPSTTTDISLTAAAIPPPGAFTTTRPCCN